jgi:hypothetical protein
VSLVVTTNHRGGSHSGGAIVVPPHTPFSLAAAGSRPLVALAYLPVGGQAKLDGGEPFTPPWAQ